LKLGQRFAVGMCARAVACGVAASFSAAAAHAETDPSFLLTARPNDFSAYFPSYLANGYLSTMTGPRGTEANLAYVVAFMDYAKDDIARPAAIPGWSGIDYSTGSTSAGEFWLNQTKLSAKAFADYSQTLNLYDATLSTSYRYTDDSQRSTDIRVTSFVSQASPHLAAARIAITPDFSGTVRLMFWFTLWAPHQPRFPIRTMNGEEMLAAVDANNMSVLEPVNAVTAKVCGDGYAAGPPQWCCKMCATARTSVWNWRWSTRSGASRSPPSARWFPTGFRLDCCCSPASN